MASGGGGDSDAQRGGAVGMQRAVYRLMRCGNQFHVMTRNGIPGDIIAISTRTVGHGSMERQEARLVARIALAIQVDDAVCDMCNGGCA